MKRSFQSNEDSSKRQAIDSTDQNPDPNPAPQTETIRQPIPEPIPEPILKNYTTSEAIMDSIEVANCVIKGQTSSVEAMNKFINKLYDLACDNNTNSNEILVLISVIEFYQYIAGNSLSFTTTADKWVKSLPDILEGEETKKRFLEIKNTLTSIQKVSKENSEKISALHLIKIKPITVNLNYTDNPSSNFPPVDRSPIKKLTESGYRETSVRNLLAVIFDFLRIAIPGSVSRVIFFELKISNSVNRIRSYFNVTINVEKNIDSTTDNIKAIVAKNILRRIIPKHAEDGGFENYLLALMHIDISLSSIGGIDGKNYVINIK